MGNARPAAFAVCENRIGYTHHVRMQKSEKRACGAAGLPGVPWPSARLLLGDAVHVSAAVYHFQCVYPHHFFIREDGRKLGQCRRVIFSSPNCGTMTPLFTMRKFR